MNSWWAFLWDGLKPRHRSFLAQDVASRASWHRRQPAEPSGPGHLPAELHGGAASGAGCAEHGPLLLFGVYMQVALGMAAVNTGEVQYDQRLFNQDQGLGSGFTADDVYGIYDKPLFADRSAAGGPGWPPAWCFSPASVLFRPAAAVAHIQHACLQPTAVVDCIHPLLHSGVAL